MGTTIRGALYFVIFSIAPVVAQAQTASENTASACRNGADDDADGAVDCADTECQVMVFCASAEEREPTVVIERIDTPTPETGTPTGPVREGSVPTCTDAEDNDGDGAVDCHDSECQGWTFCRRILAAEGREPSAPAAPPAVEPTTPTAPTPTAPTPTAPTTEEPTTEEPVRGGWGEANVATINSAGASSSGGWSERGEVQGHWYYEVGALFRYVFFPDWLMKAFAEFPDGVAAPFIANPGAGATFAARRNGFEIDLNFWWAGYMHEEFLAGPHNSYETPVFHDWSQFSVLVLNVDFVWSHDFTDWLAVTYGVGLGAAFTLDRGEATAATSLSSDSSLPVETAATYNGETVGQARFVRCDRIYGSDCSDNGLLLPPSIIRQPDMWSAFPWANLLLGLRFKPHRHIAINLDAGLGAGWLVGLRISYVI